MEMKSLAHNPQTRPGKAAPSLSHLNEKPFKQKARQSSTGQTHRATVYLMTGNYGLNGVSEGARTLDNWSHNPALYQLSYTHHEKAAESY
jgi:hypothetical protein